MAIGRNGRRPGKNNITIRRIDLPKGTNIEKFLKMLSKELEKEGFKPIQKTDEKTTRALDKLLNMHGRPLEDTMPSSLKTKTKIKSKKKATTKAKKKAVKGKKNGNKKV